MVNDTQIMTLEGVLPLDATMTLGEMVRSLEADGFTIVLAASSPPEPGAKCGPSYRIVATYPSAWMLSGWMKGQA
jgi:hypothetical protein